MTNKRMRKVKCYKRELIADRVERRRPATPYIPSYR